GRASCPALDTLRPCRPLQSGRGSSTSQCLCLKPETLELDSTPARSPQFPNSFLQVTPPGGEPVVLQVAHPSCRLLTPTSDPAAAPARGSLRSATGESTESFLPPPTRLASLSSPSRTRPRMPIRKGSSRRFPTRGLPKCLAGI